MTRKKKKRNKRLSLKRKEREGWKDRAAFFFTSYLVHRGKEEKERGIGRRP